MGEGLDPLEIILEQTQLHFQRDALGPPRRPCYFKVVHDSGGRYLNKWQQPVEAERLADPHPLCISVWPRAVWDSPLNSVDHALYCSIRAAQQLVPQANAAAVSELTVQDTSGPGFAQPYNVRRYLCTVTFLHLPNGVAPSAQDGTQAKHA